ncbi:RHS repeat-associated core domain-containing protein [Microcystis aeruginosa CS-567/02]|nr:RHS repeat-associated core domain-containing protein [Microcystis aeruginosa]MDB9412849.1 RHS repeat-associated core domain-containing protein [Microcystis aeruginosa CS-567/02]
MTGNNGSVIVEYDYDAYGNLTRKVGDADNNYLFAGEQFDEAVDGYYLRARYYDPNTGRFASVDPFEGYNNQPIILHDYLYAGVNPVNAIDPSGEVSLLEYRFLIQLTYVVLRQRFINFFYRLAPLAPRYNKYQKRGDFLDKLIDFLEAIINSL